MSGWFVLERIEVQHRVELPLARFRAVAVAGVMPGVVHPDLANWPRRQRVHQRQRVAPGVLLFHVAEQQRHDAVEADRVELLSGAALHLVD
jgi:hypothetical protein